MQKNNILALALLAALPISTQAQDSSQESVKQFSAGLKLGMFMVDSGAATGYENATGTQVSLDDSFGFGLHGDYLIKDNWYVDVEYTSASFDVKTSGGNMSAKGSIDVKSFAVYGAYRSQGDLYYVGKLGLINEDVSGGGVSESEVGLSFSFGAGFKVQEDFFIEAEFTSIEEDVGFLGVTARYSFH